MQTTSQSSFVLKLALSLGPLTFLPAHATGQEQANSTTTAVSPAIVLATTDPSIGIGFHTEYNGEGELPDLPLDHHFAFVLSSDGKLKSETRSGDIGYLKATLHPNALLKLYQEQIDESWETIRDSGALGLTQVGISAKQAAILMRGVRTFPEQIQAIDITVSQNPLTRVTGMRVGVQVRPTKGSWLSGFAARLRPHPQGALSFKKQNAMLAMSCAVETSGLQDLISPLTSVFAQVGARNKKQRTNNESILNKLFREFDGRFTSSGNPYGGGVYTIAGIRNPEVTADFLKGGDYAEYMTAVGRGSRLVTLDAEVERISFSHREVPVTKTTIISEHDITPTLPSGDQVSFSAVAGRHLISTTNFKPAKIKSLIDASLDQKIQRKPVPDNALAIVDVRLMDLLDTIGPAGNPFDGLEDSPEKLRISLDSKGGSLNLRIIID